jgi:atlastin
MWSEPFIRPTSATNGEPIAILLMDTQGMFDNETTMTLTAQIFGLSTLVSSFQIYNVDKRIQEDNLQHLALFSEYGRMALLPQVSRRERVGKRDKRDEWNSRVKFYFVS